MTEFAVFLTVVLLIAAVWVLFYAIYAVGVMHGSTRGVESYRKAYRKFVR